MAGCATSHVLNHNKELEVHLVDKNSFLELE